MEAGGTAGRATAVGLDVGTTLAKLALREPDGALRYRLGPSRDLEALLRLVEASGAPKVGLTGGGTELAARRLSGSVPIDEFAAWARGAAHLLESAGARPEGRYLLVSIGTGTSVLRVERDEVRRVGGSALGGGTLLGLGALLLGQRSFAELVALAERGERRRVDLVLGDVYGPGIPPSLRDLTASCFGRLARSGPDAPAPAPQDLAHALWGLVAENVALICAGLAEAHAAPQVVFGGTALRGNAPLEAVLRATMSAHGRSVSVMRDGEYAGAVGALLHAEATYL